MEMVEGGDTNQNETIDQLILYFLPTVITVPPLGLPSNTWVIHILLRKPGICSTSDIFTLNLALINMLFCLLVFAEYIRLLYVRTLEATEFIAWGHYCSACQQSTATWLSATQLSFFISRIPDCDCRCAWW